jgi:nicotinamide-nucleotide adenylyltransferase
VRGLLIGRFQPFHLGHLAVVREIRARRPADPLILGIGSAQLSYTWENPFTTAERFEMTERALREAKLSECVIVPVVDIDRHALWVAHVAATVPAFDRVYTNNPLTRELFERGGYPVESTALHERDVLEGTRIRTAIADDEGWEARVPPAVAAYLRELRAVHRLRLLREAGAPEAGTRS